MSLYREKIFPWILDHAVSGEKLEHIRDRLVDQATGHVIEIGSGTGANFMCYSSSITSLTTIEPNPGMNRRARQRIKYLEFPVDSREISGESLPMKDASFDCAVSTLTICSLPDARQCLGELYRVLKPGGKLLFLEHGLGESERLRRWQKRITPVQQKLFDGCSLDKPIDGLIRESGFEIEALSNYYLPKAPRVLAYMYEGVATR